MKTVQIIITIFLIVLFSSIVHAQDIIYTLAGEIDGERTSIDSIALENLTNGTFMGFGNLTVHNDYRINLTKNSFWGSTSSPIIAKDRGFLVTKNQPGSFKFESVNNIETEVQLVIYNINGQRVASTSDFKTGKFSSFLVEIGSPGFYIVSITTPYQTQIFRAIGCTGRGNITIKTSTGSGNSIQTKSKTIRESDDFHFSPGDSIKISIFKKGYVAEPELLQITSNESLVFSFLACLAPVVFTFAADEVLFESVTLHGQIINESPCEIVEKGFYLSKSDSIPGGNDSIIVIRDTSSIFKANLTGLDLYATYYFAAFAKNSSGISFGKVDSITPGILVDTRDDHVYKTLKIGSQIWMTENLAFLPEVDSQTVSSRTEKIYYVNEYNGNDVNRVKTYYNYKMYGALYNWPAAMDGCPAGWHLPLLEEFSQLENYLADNGYNYDGTIGGGGEKIGKALASKNNWKSSDIPGSPGNDMTKNNSSGFSAVGGGSRGWNGWYYVEEWLGNWWSRSEYNKGNVFDWGLYYNDTGTRQYYDSKSSGNSVRCVKDDSTTIRFPQVSTTEISFFNPTNATCGGTAISDGGAPIIARGVCWNATGNPHPGENKTVDGADIGSFSSNIAGLSANTKYYVRAYATNRAGTGYGEEISFTTTDISLPTVAIEEIVRTGFISARCSCKVVFTGGTPITDRGVCWSTSPNPTIKDNQPYPYYDDGKGNFTCNLSGLKPASINYVRAFARNKLGIVYGNQLSIETSYDSITDSRDGHVYKVFRIGNKTWMAENLAYLPTVSPPNKVSYTEKYNYVYDYNGTNVDEAMASEKYKLYGALYNWVAATEACPAEWHLPSDFDWKELEMYLGMTQKDADLIGYRGSDQGSKLKATYGWYEENNGINYSGFTALPGGHQYTRAFSNEKYCGYWWSNTEKNMQYSFGRQIWYSGSINRDVMEKEFGVSVRCIKDKN